MFIRRSSRGKDLRDYIESFGRIYRYSYLEKTLLHLTLEFDGIKIELNDQIDTKCVE